MSNDKAPKTVVSAIISAIKKSPNKQVTLDELYTTVPKLLGRTVNGDTIRGIIYRSLETRNKQGPYPIYFRRVASATFTLAKK